MPAEVYSLHGSGASALSAAQPEKKRTLKYEKNMKRPVDENAPKKPLSAYFQWAAGARSKVADEVPDGNLQEITKKLGSMWRELPKEEKTEWEQKYKKQQAIYQNLMTAYKLTSNHSAFEETWKKYQINQTYKPYTRDENAPKKALSAYMIFATDTRPEFSDKNPDAKQSEIMKLIGAAWKDTSEKKKQPYEKRAKEAAAQYLKDKEAYQNSDKYKKYVEDKKNYELRMKAKRERLVKQGIKAKASNLASPAGSGATPNPKRRKTNSKAAAKSKKTSSSKKKKSAPKKVPSAKVAPVKKKKKSAAKSSKKKGSKKKVSKDKKKSERKKAKKNARTKSKK